MYQSSDSLITQAINRILHYHRTLEPAAKRDKTKRAALLQLFDYKYVGPPGLEPGTNQL